MDNSTDRLSIKEVVRLRPVTPCSHALFFSIIFFTIKKRRETARLDVEKVSFLVIIFFLLTFVGYSFFPQSLAYRSAVFICALVFPVAVLYFTFSGKRFVAFSKKSFAEVKKLVWPSKSNTLKIGLLILVVMALMVIVISLFDVLWSFLIYQLLLGLHS